MKTHARCLPLLLLLLLPGSVAAQEDDTAERLQLEKGIEETEAALREVNRERLALETKLAKFRARLKTIAPAPQPEGAPRETVVASRSAPAPVLDGRVDPADGWPEAKDAGSPFGPGKIRIRAKHDGKQLYVLAEFDGLEGSPPQLALYFEDDGLTPDRRLDPLNEDSKYLLEGGFERLNDAHWDDGWSVRAESGPKASGKVAGAWANGKWTVEWSLPLSTGDAADIDVTGNETLGFAIVDWRGGMAGRHGSWPAEATPYKPELWGDLVVVFD